MIDITGANAYFAEHYAGAVWLAFPIAARTAAIASARRLLAKALGRAMNDDEPAYVEGQMYSEAFSCYEQALYFLQTGRIADGANNSPYPVAMSTAGEDKPIAKAQPHPLYSEAALRWLAQYNTVSITRG
jgi:hypothetical protein